MAHIYDLKVDGRSLGQKFENEADVKKAAKALIDQGKNCTIDIMPLGLPHGVGFPTLRWDDELGDWVSLPV